MPFNLFRKKKPEEEAAANAPPQQEQTEQAQPQKEPEAPQPQEPLQEPSSTPVAEEPAPEPAVPEPAPEQPMPQPEVEEQPVEQPPQEPQQVEAAPSKTYLKAMPLRDLADIENVKNEVLNGNIIILKVTPLAQKSIEDVKTAVNDLFQFAESIGGDIARLGEERVVICPKTVRIWREKTPKPTTDAPVPTAA